MPNQLHARKTIRALPYYGCATGQIVQFFDTEFAPCSCHTHNCIGVPCIGVELRGKRARCLNCGEWWVRDDMG